MLQRRSNEIIYVQLLPLNINVLQQSRCSVEQDELVCVLLESDAPRLYASKVSNTQRGLGKFKNDGNTQSFIFSCVPRSGGELRQYYITKRYESMMIRNILYHRASVAVRSRAMRSNIRNLTLNLIEHKLIQSLSFLREDTNLLALKIV